MAAFPVPTALPSEEEIGASLSGASVGLPLPMLLSGCPPLTTEARRFAPLLSALGASLNEPSILRAQPSSAGLPAGAADSASLFQSASGSTTSSDVVELSFATIGEFEAESFFGRLGPVSMACAVPTSEVPSPFTSATCSSCETSAEKFAAGWNVLPPFPSDSQMPLSAPAG